MWVWVWVGGCVLEREGALWRLYSRAGHHLHWPVTGNAFHPLKQFPRRHPVVSCGTPARPCVEASPSPRQCLGEAEGLSVPQGPNFLPHPMPTGLAPVSSAVSLLIPLCSLLGQRRKITVCEVYLPAPNIMEAFKTRGLLESDPSWWTVGP